MDNIFFANINGMEKASDASLIATSQQLLLTAKKQQPTDALVEVMKSIPEEALTQQLRNDNLKKAFWINLYNAFTQIILLKHPDNYKTRSVFFEAKQIAIAGRKLSLDDIEHGILRRSKIKWSLGYLNKWLPSAFEKRQRVDTLDYRVHFSLNCGAKSCPPIAFYKPEQLDQQLDMATKAYLQDEAKYYERDNTVALPAIMGWFRADFGGKNKMIDLLHILQIVPKEKRPYVKFKEYNWSLFLENYKSE
jgi:hypothetical protein